MADYKSTQETNKDTTGKYDAREVARMTKTATITYVMTAAEAATETVTLWTPPANTVVHGYDITSDGIATTATVDIGVVGGSADSICDGADVAAAGLDSGRCHVAADGKEIYLTFATLATPVAAKTLTIDITYAHNT